MEKKQPDSEKLRLKREAAKLRLLKTRAKNSQITITSLIEETLYGRK